jgi:hypothetical protein
MFFLPSEYKRLCLTPISKKSNYSHKRCKIITFRPLYRWEQKNILKWTGSYCSILWYCVDLTLCSISCPLCATSVNILLSSLYCHCVFQPKWPLSAGQVVVITEPATHCNAVLLFLFNCLRLILCYVDWQAVAMHVFAGPLVHWLLPSNKL